MRKFSATLLLILYVCTATELPQLAKLPLLLVHYLDHATREQVTIGTFFAEHYLHGDVFDTDRSQDMQLPFKGELPGAFLILAEPLPLDITVPRDIPPQQIYYHSCPPSAPLSGISPPIWHPPAQTCA
jgi:hypothetical protein